MQPLTPDDLLIRHKPVDGDRWLDAQVSSSPQPAVSLERFQTLEHVIRDSPINAAPYLELARIYLQNQRWNDARRVLDLAYARFVDNEEVLFLREEAQIARSLQLHSEAELQHKQEPTMLTEENLDRCRVELNVLRERVCRDRLKRHPQQVELNLPLATALNNLGQRDEAIRCLELAAEYPKLRAAASLQLGGILESMKRIPAALSAYRRAAMFRVPPPPADIKREALMAAANLSERSNLIDSARRYVALLLEATPEDADLKARFQRLVNEPL